jgi:flagellar hook-basal body complex protein FliE
MSDLTIKSKVLPGNDISLGKNDKKSAEGFGDVMKQAVKRVNDMDIEADQAVEKLATGKMGIHESMIALEKAGISRKLLIQVRNKALESYREIMRMPI